MPFYRSRGLRLHYEVVGEGPAVVLLHGLSNFCFAWAPQLDTVVGAGWQGVLVDLAGHWLSDPVTAPTTTADLATDVVALLDELGIASAAVCGLSLGGMVAQQLLVDHPDRILGAVVAATGPHLTFPGMAEMVAGWQALWRSENGAVRRHEAAWPLLTTEGYRTAVAGQAYFEGWRQVLSRVDGAARAHAAEGLLSFDVRDGLAAVACPVVAVAGEHDAVAPPAVVWEVADRVPGARFEVLAGAGHVSNRERPDLFNRLLGDFLRQWAPRTDP